MKLNELHVTNIVTDSDSTKVSASSGHYIYILGILTQGTASMKVEFTDDADLQDLKFTGGTNGSGFFPLLAPIRCKSFTPDNDAICVCYCELTY